MLATVRIVVAPDSFKGSLSAEDAAVAISEGIARVLPDAEVLLRPIADGGEGTVAAALRAGYTPLPARVAGPDGRPVDATVAATAPRRWSSSPRPRGSGCWPSPPR